ncbi:hypothetical protein KIW84_062441 [Lathyrus oleraceus]|uniref:Uncharacterized protein n=1 Tax=Pisum sativum TaxID=3888 RepID=A0A9D4W8F5_PEA|nr:hypothetical protein KIW84_062441 [Pisum sativum]
MTTSPQPNSFGNGRNSFTSNIRKTCLTPLNDGIVLNEQKDLEDYIEKQKAFYQIQDPGTYTQLVLETVVIEILSLLVSASQIVQSLVHIVINIQLTLIQSSDSLHENTLDIKNAAANGNAQHLDEETIHFPPGDKLLSTCTKLLMKEPLAFLVCYLFVMTCSQDDDKHRSTVVTFIVDRIKECSIVSSNENYIMLATLFHVLALILNEDLVAREVSYKSGLIRIASPIYSTSGIPILIAKRKCMLKYLELLQR